MQSRNVEAAGLADHYPSAHVADLQGYVICIGDLEINFRGWVEGVGRQRDGREHRGSRHITGLGFHDGSYRALQA